MPRGNAVVVSEALPPERLAVPRMLAPKVKVTVPVAATPVFVVTVAVNFTDCPDVDGFLDDTSVVVEGTTFTIWVSPAELLADCVSPL